MNKKCTKCKTEKTLSEFYKDASTKDGLRSECKTCTNVRIKTRQERNARTNPRKPYVNETRPSIYEDAIEVKLYGNNNLWTILDLEYFERLCDHKFYLNAGYAAIQPDVKYVRVHKLIVDYPIVDHINRNRLDNRKANLRSVTQGQNSMNRSKSSRKTSGYKGVCWHKSTQKWRARIRLNGCLKHLGHFDDIIEAAKAYDKAASEHFGEFAVLNMHDDDDEE